MKFYLMKHEQLTLQPGEASTERGHTLRRTIIPVRITPSGPSDEEKLFCESVKKKIEKEDKISSKPNQDGDKDLIFSMATEGDALTGYVGVADGFGNVLKKLETIFGIGNVSLELTITNFRDTKRASPANSFNISTKELCVYFHDLWQVHMTNEAKFEFEEDLFHKFNNAKSSQLGGSITIMASVDTTLKECNNCVEKFQVYKRMLHEEICSDVEILAKDGNPIKCHKAMLSTQSSVLRALFQTELGEGNKTTVEMPEMSEKTVRAFLAFLYHWEISPEVYQRSQVAFDLFHAGHMYDVPSLERAIGKVFLNKGDHWFDAEVALKLFLFARNLCGSCDDDDDKEGEDKANHNFYYDLKKKAVKVLKGNFCKLEKLPCYEQLFKDEPNAAMELCKHAFFTGP